MRGLLPSVLFPLATGVLSACSEPAGTDGGAAGTSAVGGAATGGSSGATAGSATSGGGGGGAAGGLAGSGAGETGGSANGGTAGASGMTQGGGGGAAGAAGGSAGSSGGGMGAQAGAAAGGAAGAGAGAGGSAAGAVNCPNPTTLKAAGACTGRPIGVALTNRLMSETQYRTAALEFDYVTAENEMKWDVTEPTRNTFAFTEGDRIVDFAVANGMAVKGHTLVWHSQLPTWLTNLTSASEVRSAMLNHIRSVMQHYGGEVVAWDVVNEAFDDNGVLRNSVFQTTIGSSYIEEAFRAAREADATAKLYYNDFDIENAGAKADAAYEMVRDLKTRGVPIDGVGMQMHTRSTDEDPPVPEFVANLQRIVALGLEVVISEMDVRVCSGGTFQQQARRYHDIIAACLAEPRCTAITFWGISDKDSWLNTRTDLTCVGSDPPRPLLWDDSYAKKPAYSSVMDALLGR